MVEPIEVKIAGGKVVISAVEMTSQGVETNGLDAFRRYNAGIVCYRTNNAFIDGKQRNPDGLNPVMGIDKPGTILGYKYLNFGAAQVTNADRLQLRLNIQQLQATMVSVQVAQSREANDAAKRVEIASINLHDVVAVDGQYHEVSVSLTGLDDNPGLKAIGGLKGRLAVFLVFNGKAGELCRVKEFEFAKGDAPTPNPLREVRIGANHVPGMQVTARPVKARVGESVKLSVVPDTGKELKSIKVVDAKGNAVKLNPNGAAPHAPKSFNFEMPAAAVDVFAE